MSESIVDFLHATNPRMATQLTIERLAQATAITSMADLLRAALPYIADAGLRARILKEIRPDNAESSGQVPS